MCFSLTLLVPVPLEALPQHSGVSFEQLRQIVSAVVDHYPEEFAPDLRIYVFVFYSLQAVGEELFPDVVWLVEVFAVG